MARATANGAETDIAAGGSHLPGTLLTLLAIASGLALLILPVALAARQFARRQPRRLGEALATSAVTVGVVVAANALLRLPDATDLYQVLTVTRSGLTHTAPLDGYLAAFAAYVAVIDLSGRPRWRAAVWLTVGAYAITSLVAIHATALSLAITLVLGETVGLAVRYGAGLPSQRPGAQEIAETLSSAGLPVATISRQTKAGAASRSYAATTCDGDHLDVAVFDRDQQAAGALYRVYRLRAAAQARWPGVRRCRWSTRVERSALLILRVVNACGGDAAAAGRRPGRSRRYRAGLRPLPGSRPGRVRLPAERCPAQPGVGHRAADARPRHHPPGAHRGPHPGHRRRRGGAAGPRQRRRGRQ